MIKKDCNLTLPQMVYNNRNKIIDILNILEHKIIKNFKINISKEAWSDYPALAGAKQVVISIPYSEDGIVCLSPDTQNGDNTIILLNYAKINELRYIGAPGVSENNWLLVAYNGAPTIDLTLNATYAKGIKLKCEEEA